MGTLRASISLILCLAQGLPAYATQPVAPTAPLGTRLNQSTIDSEFSQFTSPTGQSIPNNNRLKLDCPTKGEGANRGVDEQKIRNDLEARVTAATAAHKRAGVSDSPMKEMTKFLASGVKTACEAVLTLQRESQAIGSLPQSIPSGQCEQYNNLRSTYRAAGQASLIASDKLRNVLKNLQKQLNQTHKAARRQVDAGIQTPPPAGQGIAAQMATFNALDQEVVKLWSQSAKHWNDKGPATYNELLAEAIFTRHPIQIYQEIERIRSFSSSSTRQDETLHKKMQDCQSLQGGSASGSHSMTTRSVAPRDVVEIPPERLGQISSTVSRQTPPATPREQAQPMPAARGSAHAGGQVLPIRDTDGQVHDGNTPMPQGEARTFQQPPTGPQAPPGPQAPAGPQVPPPPATPPPASPPASSGAGNWLSENSSTLLIGGGLAAAAAGALYFYKNEQNKDTKNSGLAMEQEALAQSMARQQTSSTTVTTTTTTTNSSTSTSTNTGTGGPYKMGTSGLPSSAVAGQTLPTVRVWIQDYSGNLKAEDGVEITASCVQAVCGLTGELTVRTVRGEAIFSRMSFASRRGNVRIRFTSPNLPELRSGSINVQ